MSKKLFREYVLLLVIMNLIVSCKNKVSTSEPSPVPKSIDPTPMVILTPTALPLPTLEGGPNGNPTGLTLDKCLVQQQLLPNVCGIVPGQTSQEEVEKLIGSPTMVYTDTKTSYDFGPGWETVDTCWVGQPTVYFANGIVVGTLSGVRANKLTLGEAVQILGPPEQVILYLQYDAAPLEWEDRRANMAIFLWPNNGVYLGTGLYETTGVDLDKSTEVPHFPARLSIDGLVTFKPCTLEELQAYFLGFGYSPDHPGERWVEWTGLEE